MAKPDLPPAGLSGLESMIWLRDAGHVIALNHPSRPGYLWKLPVFEPLSSTALAAAWHEYDVTRYAFRLKPIEIVIDIDGENAAARWRAMQRKYLIQNTRIVRTPSGGLHVYLYIEPGTPIRYGTDVLPEFGACDVFSSNSGLITGPGSIRPASENKCAGAYLWCTPQTELAHVTPSLAEALKPPPVIHRVPARRASHVGDIHPVCQSILDEDLAKVANCGKGSRNKALYSVSANLFAMAAAGEIPAPGLEGLLIEAAKACGLADKDETGIIGIKKTIASGRKRGEADPRCLESYRENYDRKRAAHAATNKPNGVGSSGKGQHVG